MAGTTPYIIPLNVVLVANATGTLSFLLPPAQRLHVHEWYWTSTGVFSITDLRMQTSLRITNASGNVPILSTMVRNPGNAFLMLTTFAVDWVIEPNNSLFIDVKDTSGAGNTINCVLNGSMEYL